MSSSASSSGLSVGELIRSFASGDLSPVEVARASLERIDRYDGALNAFCYLDPDTTLEAAKQSEQRWRSNSQLGRFDGIPVAVKDIFLTAGWPTLRGSRTIDPNGVWNDDAPAVARLREAGAVMVGKTTTPEYGWKPVTDSPLTGVTANPWRRDLTSGGSSGGSGAALAAGIAPLALGTDGGGSIRIPASFCGVVGLKPTFGRVPLWPASPFGTLAHVGPMARSVEDAAAFLDLLSIPDWRDTTTLPPAGVSHLEGLDAGIAGLRIAYCPSWSKGIDPDVASVTEQVARTFVSLGARVETVEAPFATPVEAFGVLWEAGAAKALSTVVAAKADLMDPGLVESVHRGQQLSALDYLNAVAVRSSVAEACARLFNNFDLLLTPAVAVRPFGIGRNVPEGWHGDEWVNWTPFSYPFNMTGQPALVLPGGFTDDHLPVGVQLVGARFQDRLLLAAGHAVEAALALDLDPLLD